MSGGEKVCEDHFRLAAMIATTSRKSSMYPQGFLLRFAKDDNLIMTNFLKRWYRMLLKYLKA